MKRPAEVAAGRLTQQEEREMKRMQSALARARPVVRADAWPLCALSILGALAIAACGSSNSAANGSGSTASAANSATGGSTSACLQQAKQVVQAAEAPMKIETPSQPIDMSKLKGKTVYYIGIGSGYSQRLADGFVAAAHAAGLNPVVFNGLTPQQWDTGIEQAVSRHAGGVVFMPATPTLVQPALAQAKAAGMPVVGEQSVPPSTAGTAATVLVKTDTGKQVAAYAALRTNCNVHAIVSFDPAQDGLVAIGNAMKNELKALCPSTCTFQDLPISIATMATKAAPALQEALQRTPSTDAVMPTFDSLGLLMSPALASSGSKAKIYSMDGDPASLALVQKGLQPEDYAYAPTEYQGYIDLDALARTMLKLPANPPAVQFQMFTTQNLPKTESFAAMWPNLAGYQRVFMKLWGLS
jgi:ribose transport system substrate-binding protein